MTSRRVLMELTVVIAAAMVVMAVVVLLIEHQDASYVRDGNEEDDSSIGTALGLLAGAATGLVGALLVVLVETALWVRRRRRARRAGLSAPGVEMSP
jgi:hypothetical protein